MLTTTLKIFNPAAKSVLKQILIATHYISIVECDSELYKYKMFVYRYLFQVYLHPTIDLLI